MRSIDGALRSLAIGRAPPPSDALEATVRRAAAVRTRVPAREIAALVALSVPLALLHAYSNGLRADLDHVSRSWLVAVGATWLVAFVGSMTAILLPARGSVLSAPSRVLGAAALVPAFVVALGFTVAGSVAPASATSSDEWHRIAACLLSGVEVAAMPFIAALVVLRRVLPVDARGVGAALGAAGGALGGFALHLQCEAGGALHAGIGHGGAAVVGAFLGYWAIGRLPRMR